MRVVSLYSLIDFAASCLNSAAVSPRLSRFNPTLALPGLVLPFGIALGCIAFAPELASRRGPNRTPAGISVWWVGALIALWSLLDVLQRGARVGRFSLMGLQDPVSPDPQFWTLVIVTFAPFWALLLGLMVMGSSERLATLFQQQDAVVQARSQAND
ncbi:MAG: hypothetical protein JSS66_16420 [Armatimonadetes bacterium]|nr:hypothetical protein [Armatimonadota bacterium]